MSGGATRTQVALEEALRKSLTVLHLVVVDFSGGCDGAKLDLYLCSDEFEGMKLLDRHRLVNSIVTEAGLYTQAIHALTIKAWTREEWEKKQATIPSQMQQAQADVTTPRSS